ncbi:hypothetical protein ACSF6V_09945 [Escherichia coli]|uniref:hypothetical protein n=1 Tax=Escherichia coli TaxID=562 RepID=UPI003EED4030
MAVSMDTAERSLLADEMFQRDKWPETLPGLLKQMQQGKGMNCHKKFVMELVKHCVVLPCQEVGLHCSFC